jgi:uncharacterized protein
MIEVKVQSLGLDQASQTPVVILQEVDGERVLPIWIGPGEASAIAMQLAGMKFGRPLTHDLAASLVRGLGGVLSRVVITRVEDNTYFAEMVITRGDEVISVDARPSDSIAIALRLDCQLFTSDALLAATAIELSSEAPPEFAAEGGGEGGEEGEEGAGGMTPEQLQEYLRKLNPEDLGRFNP